MLLWGYTDFNFSFIENDSEQEAGGKHFVW